MRILVVHQTAAKGLRDNYRDELAAQADVALFDFPIKEPLPEEATGLLCVGLRPKQAKELHASLGSSCELTQIKKLKNSARQLLAWLNGESEPLDKLAPTKVAVPSPWPGYQRYITQASEIEPRLLVSSTGLARADKVACNTDVYTERFPAFLVAALGQLRVIAEAEVDLRVDVELQKAPDVKYAPTGGDYEPRYECPFTGEARKTKRHLKPRNERTGYYPAEQKPRLYFDIIKCADDERQWVVVLYFGPHPQAKTNADFSVRKEPNKQNS